MDVEKEQVFNEIGEHIAESADGTYSGFEVVDGVPTITILYGSPTKPGWGRSMLDLLDIYLWLDFIIIFAIMIGIIMLLWVWLGARMLLLPFTIPYKIIKRIFKR
jgi:hypothetical protein